jgi:transposase-like protein
MKTTTAAPAPDDDPLKNIPWYTPVTVLHLADGSTLVKPGKAIQRGTAKKVARAFGVSPRTLSRLAEAGLIRQARLSPQVTLYYPGEIQKLIEETEANPDYWNDKRLREYGLARAVKRNTKRKGEDL